jgi:hypothetical protein
MSSRDPGSAPLVVSTAVEIDRLRTSPQRLWAARGPFELRLPGLTPAHREEAEARLDELARVCGCAEGAAAGALTLAGVVAVWLVRGVEPSGGAFAASAGVVIGAALAAKVVRVTFARVAMRRILGALLPAAAPHPVPPGHSGALP